MVHFIFIPPMHSYVTDVLVYNLHKTIFSRVYSYVTRMLLMCSFSHNRDLGLNNTSEDGCTVEIYLVNYRKL